LQKTNSNDRVRVEKKEVEMADDVTDQDKAATVPKVEAACAAAVSWVIAAKVKTTIAVSISMAIMFAVVVTGEVAIVTPKPPSSSLQCKVSVVYVASWNQTTFVIATGKNQVVATIPVGDFGVVVTPDGTRAYVIGVSGGHGTVSVIDTVTNSVLTIIPLVNGIYLRGVAISPDGTRVYVVYKLSTAPFGVLSTIDTATNQVISTIQFNNIFPGIPYNIVLHPDGTRAYLAGFTPGIVVFDTVKQLVIDVIPVGPRMMGMAITPDGTQLYLTPEDIYVGHKNGVTVVDTATDQVKTFIPIPSNYSDSVAVSPDGKRAYAASYGHMDAVTVIDTATNLALEHIPIPNSAMLGVVVSADGTQIYVTDGSYNTVFIIDAATNKVIGDIVLGAGNLSPNAMAAAWIPC
jgi:YVTN family beta-propeller protein